LVSLDWKVDVFFFALRILDCVLNYFTEMDPDAVFERHAVQRFNGSNFQNWKFRLETYLDQQELLCFIKQPVKSMIEFNENDSSA